MNKIHQSIWAIVPAAGIGERMGNALPKQYLTLHHKPLLAHTLEAIGQIPDIRQVIIPLHPHDRYWSSLIHLSYDHYVTILGGQLRYQSVLNALTWMKEQASPNDWVLVHDAVRPCVTAKQIHQLLTTLIHDPVGGLWGVPVRDTLKQVDAQHRVECTIARDTLWHAQTPQIFRYELLYAALQKAKTDNIEITDEASAIEYLGYHPKMVQGDYRNIKITWPEDLDSAQHWFLQQEALKCE